MVELKKETYSKSEVEKLLNEIEEDKLAWIRVKDDEKQRLKKELSERLEWYNSYIASVSENGFVRYQKLEEKTSAEIKELKLQLEQSNPEVADEARINWWSREYPEVAKGANQIKKGAKVVPSDFIDWLVLQNKLLEKKLKDSKVE